MVNVRASDFGINKIIFGQNDLHDMLVYCLIDIAENNSFYDF